jgi:hypothetical protein
MERVIVDSISRDRLSPYIDYIANQMHMVVHPSYS